MKRTVAIGAITAVAIAGALTVTVLVHGPPKPFVPGLLLVVLLWLGIRSAMGRFGSRRD